MRERVIAMLDLPRKLVRAEMELLECPHNGDFDSGDVVCQECTDGAECQWLYATDTVAALGARPLDQLSKALEFAVVSVAANVVEKDHDPLQCDCEMCSWLNQAEALHTELQQN